MPETSLPLLDFGTWSVSFPGRGHQALLPHNDLSALTMIEPPSSVPGLWLLHTGSGASVIIPDGIPVVRSGMPVVGLAVLHHGETVELANHLATFKEIELVVIEQGNRLIGHICLYCRTPFELGQTVIRCPLCGVGYCADCWEVLIGARCCSRNCRFSPAPLPGLDIS